MSISTGLKYGPHNGCSKSLWRAAWRDKFLLGVAASLFAGTGYAATITGTGSTFVLNFGVGFTGSIGESRAAVFNAAAQIWADRLISSVPIEIDAAFTSLTCATDSAVLGSAGPAGSYYLSVGGAAIGLLDNTWYPVALFNARSNSDADPGSADITATFNASMDNNNACLSNVNWYYGLDHSPSGNDIDFFEVVLHELAHGLGVLSLVDSAGKKAEGLMDGYSLYLKDKSVGPWTELSTAQILTSLTDTGGLVWTGVEVNALADTLSSGVNGGEVQMYAPSPYEGGSSVSHFDTALTPDELMEPQYTGNADFRHTLALFKDIGWQMVTGINTAPTISGQNALATNEDTSLILSTADFTLIDPDDTNFTLTVGSGLNFSVSGNTVSPAANYNGILSIPITVNDGEVDSASFAAAITVNAVNDAPVIAALTAISLAEDGRYDFDLSDVTITDPDSSAFTLSIEPGIDYQMVATSLFPAADFFGPLSVGLSVSDGDLSSAQATLTVHVTAVNDAPQLVGSPELNVVIDRDYSVQFSATDAEGDSLQYSVVSDHDWLSIDANGLLSGHPQASDIGAAGVQIRVDDGQASTEQVFTLTVSDADSADLAVNLSAANHLEGLSKAISLTLSITNSGPAVSANGYLMITLDTPASFNSLDSLCVLVKFGQVRCDFIEIGNSILLSLSVISDQAALVNAQVELFTTQSDPNSRNDWADTTLVFQADLAGPEATAPVLSGVDTRAVVTADLTGDGLIELTFANSEAQTEQIFAFDSGYHSLASRHILSGVANSHAVIAIDLNQDGRPDLVFANSGVNLIYYNQGEGVYGAPDALGQADSRAVVALDFNDDKLVDLAFANIDRANEVFLNDGRGGFVPADLLGGAESESIGLAQLDANGDGRPDLIVANRADDDYIYLNRGGDPAGSVFADSALIVGAHQSASTAVLVTDLNGDGVADDIVIGQRTSAQNPSIQIYQPSGSGQFTLRLELSAGDVRSLSAGDYNGDGEMDLGVLNDDGLVQVFTQKQGTFASALTFLSPGANALVLSDIDGNGRADLIVTGDASTASQVYFSSEPVVVPTPSSGPTTQAAPSVTVVKKSGSLGGLLVLLGLFLLLARRGQSTPYIRA
ncbi:MAG: hypothetical protein ACI9RY_000079 [Reinekea sp.]|jgi:hypothetical protein